MKPSSAPSPLQQGFYHLLSLTFLIVFGITLWMAFYSPVNADEIFWKMMISRADSDHGKLVYLFAQCQQGQWQEAPITWYPAMALHSFFYENASQPWLLRIHGWGFFIVLLAAWSWLLKRRSGLTWSDAFLAISAYFCVGVMPFLMVYSRPEQPLLLLLTLGLFSTTLLAAPIHKTHWLRGAAISLIFILLAALLAGTHPKGLFLFPVILVLAWRAMRSWIWLTILAAAMGSIAYDTQMIWQMRTHCPEFPGLMKVLQNLTLRPSLLVTEPVQFVRLAWANVMAFDAYIHSVAFQANYISSWLPDARNTWNQSSLWISLANASLAIPLCVAAVINGANWFSQRRPQNHHDILLWLTLTLALIATVSLQTAKNFYEASLIWPLILLISIFSFGRPLQAPRAGRVRLIISVLMLIAILSGYLRYERFSDDAQDWQLDRVTQLEQSTVFNPELQTLAYQQCGINPQAKRLILDKESYQSFWQHEQPIFLDYAAGWWAAESDIKATIKSRTAQGLVARCTQVPDVLRPYMQHGNGVIDGFCCIGQLPLHEAQ